MADPNRIFTVDGKPFFPVGGQATNQGGYSAERAEPAFQAVQALHGNTLLVPVYWELVEPQEGTSDFGIVDALLASARRHEMRLVLLWFATWKNGNMDYSPAWAKSDPQRFRRVTGRDGRPLWVLSAHCPATNEADRRTFAALCAHLKAVDGRERTVIALQIENEPGIIGSDRDYGPEAQAAFGGAVPAQLMKRLKAAGGGGLFDLWQRAGGKGPGTWTEAFGRDAGEVMTAWSIASYIDKVAEAGKAAYDLPMYVNVWLHQDWEVAGESYPSGGAVRNALDVYKWFAPHLDLIAPDIYIADSRGYEAICATYRREDNPLYVPESAPRGSNAWLMFRAIADYDAIGYHCFAVERALAEDGSVRPEAQPLVESFQCVAAAAPLLLKHQGTGKVHAVVQEENQWMQRLDLDGYVGKVQFGPVRGPGARPDDGVERRGRGLVIQAGMHKFYLVGDCFRLALRRKRPPHNAVDLGSSSVYFTLPLHQFISLEEGRFDGAGRFVVAHRRNGDDISQGLWVTPETGVVRAILCD